MRLSSRAESGHLCVLSLAYLNTECVPKGSYLSLPAFANRMRGVSALQGQGRDVYASRRLTAWWFVSAVWGA